jgi:hypothetical protein
MSGEQAVVLCIRDPDWENEYVVDGDVRMIDIDLGSSFNGPKYFNVDLDDAAQRDWLERVRGEVADLAREQRSPQVRRGALRRS